ncbi:MarR family transcriptional regulator with acetyltransferase activity [Tepidamorphus gemmatus]|uniref:MarR family transcriptional regulator with acetyltransferase activity n=1 Tax=Tepidamorphus gemmatus TaxID=747076 RepID=A0A4R3MMI6_9HYPH|nr:helix-turn-helix domain-containing GNAT family N-acetyltransferase [Tepidamorphus gemmatus]TCT13690.1 MarR family transcriptional regulator with acetyltransferase activity [Tepidamorphus gemmatus]
MVEAEPDPVPAVRRFTRFYTRRIGLLNGSLLDSPFTLSEARVLFEIANRDRVSASDLTSDLGLDPGYLSRMLKRFESRGLVDRRPSADDGRRRDLRLTAAGQAAFARLDEGSRRQVAEILSSLNAIDRRRLVEALETVEFLLGGGAAISEPYILRPHRPGDMGHIVSRHGALYAREYGWDETFEALVAEIVASFIRNFDPKRERCWIAERGGAILGSIFLIRESDEVARLRLLYVEPAARGLGLGRRLVAECLAFARSCGYRRVTLWTNDILHAARRIYQAEGFRLVREEPHHSFGKDLVGQYWELEL